MAQARIELNRPGVREAALRSPEIRGALRRVAEETASRARTIDASVGVRSPKSEIVVSEGGNVRARAYVRAVGPAAAAREAKYRVLGRSLIGGQ